MTLPRQVVPGRDYMITRRCSERRFFLRPDEDTTNAFVYCLALAATRANVQVTFSVAMSNHRKRPALAISRTGSAQGSIAGTRWMARRKSPKVPQPTAVC